jgi:hypothetical protein
MDLIEDLAKTVVIPYKPLSEPVLANVNATKTKILDIRSKLVKIRD